MASGEMIGQTGYVEKLGLLGLGRREGNNLWRGPSQEAEQLRE